MRIDASELNQLSATLDGATARMERQLRTFVRQTALDIERDAKRFAPVRTGNLRRSIHHRLDWSGLSATIGSNVEYAPFVEFGTSRMAPRAFLGPAFDRHQPAFVEGVTRIAGEAVLGR